MLLYICFVLVLAINCIAAASGEQFLPLLGDDVKDYDVYGYATAVYGNKAAVSAFSANKSVGAVYTFEFSLASETWVQTAKLTPFDAQIDTNFGNSLSMYENRLVIGAWADDRDEQTNVGAAYIYEYFESSSSSSSTNSSAWTFTQKLVGPEAQSEFGNAVSLYQDRLIVGAVSYKNWMGCAYIYTLDKQSSTWVLEKQLIASDAHTEGYQDTQFYGTSVTMYADIVVVGAAFDNNQSGAVYAYEYNSGAWTETKFAPKGLDDTDYFGMSVALYDKTLVVGSPGDNTPMGLNSGSIYVFQKSDNGSSWGQIAHIIASDGASSDTFGTAVDITDKIVVATSPYKTNVENNVQHLGATYLFTIDYTSNAITPIKKLIAVDPLSQMNGYSVSAFGDTVLVGVECAHTEAVPLYYNLL